jgi:hypothetical protein
MSRIVSARCTEPGCAVRFRSGADRACPLHADDGDNLASRMEAFTELSAVPAPGAKDGRPSADDGQPERKGWAPSADDGASAAQTMPPSQRSRQTVNKHGIPIR